MVNTGYISLIPQTRISGTYAHPIYPYVPAANPASLTPESMAASPVTTEIPGNEAARIQAIREIAPAIKDDEMVASAIRDGTTAEDLAYQKLLKMSEKERLKLTGKRDMIEFQSLSQQKA